MKLLAKLKKLLRIGVALSGKRDEIDALGKAAGDSALCSKRTNVRLA